MSEAGGSVDASSRTRLWPAVVAVVAMASILGVVVAIALTRDGGSDDPRTAAPGPSDAPVTSVRLEPVTYRSDEPFTESIVTVGDGELDELARSVAVRDESDAPVSGDVAGLYAVTGGRPVCDLNRLVASLAASPEATAAWAGVVGVDPSAAAATVQSFTPVVLTRDTAVTNHTYRSGEANGYASILQAGTPILVDENGTPRTQCSCGNPLLPPSEDAASVGDDTTFEGDRWESFVPKGVVQVKPAPKALRTIDAIDTETGKARSAPVGAAVELDGVLATTPDGIMVRADDGTVTPVLPDEASAAYDDGRGGLIYTLGESTADPYERVYDAPPADPAHRSIWHLPAGANEAVQLVANEDPDIWHQLFGVGQLGGRTYVMFTPLHTEDAGGDAEHAAGSLVALDLDSGGQRVLIEEAIGWEFGLGSLSFGGDLMALEVGDYSNYWVVYDAQLNEVPVPCGSGELTEEVADTCPRSGALDEQGSLNYFASGIGQEFEFIESDEIIVEDLRTRTVTARHPMNFGISTGHTQSGITEVRRGKAASWFYLGEGVDESSSMLVDVATGEPIEIPDLEVGQLSILRAPLRRPVQAEPPAAPPKAPSAVDIMNVVLPAGSCTDYQDQDSVPIQLSDGNGDTGVESADDGFVNAWVRPETTASLDVDANGASDIVTAVVCNWGGSGSATSIVSLKGTDPSAMAHAIPPLEQYSKGDRDVATLTIDADGVMTVEGPTWTENDATCCPSGSFTEKWRLEGDRWMGIG